MTPTPQPKIYKVWRAEAASHGFEIQPCVELNWSAGTMEAARVWLEQNDASDGDRLLIAKNDAMSEAFLFVVTEEPPQRPKYIARPDASRG